jgi:hydroxymethylglutaryl-CoA lyase
MSPSDNQSRALIINDVGPRDGLQNQAKVLPIEQRIALIQALIEAGLPEIEIGAFVSPKAVPAMANTADVFSALSASTPEETLLSALIPNMRGYEAARDAGVRLSSLVVAVSNTMNEKNIGMNTSKALEVCESVFAKAKQDNAPVQAYVATAWECPFEGKVAPHDMLEVAGQLVAMGASRIVVADTIGAANPDSVNSLMSLLVENFGPDIFACHFHDTRAMGLANVYAAITAGVRRFDASIAGLGGCPFAPGASGNVATEDVVMMAEQMGFNTGIDIPKLLQASDLAIQLTGTATGGKAKLWLEKYYK